MTPGLFAAITLEVKGGGVAVAAQLMWRVLQEDWGAPCQLVMLIDEDATGAEFQATTLARVKFGARVAAAQALGRADWIFYSHLSLAQVQEFLPAAVRRPYVVFLHGIEAWRPLSPACRRALGGASLVVANSTYTARRVASAHPWIGPIAVCHLALPPLSEFPAATPDQRQSDLQSPIVLVVGRMSSDERYKGHDQLLEAWTRVRAAQPGARLVFVGGGDDLERLQAKARALQHGASVVFTGFIPSEKLAALYREAMVFAMPSRNEGFGLVYLEAMAHSLPCIASIHDAAGDVIDDGVTGFLVDQGNTTVLADRIGQLLSDSDLRCRLGANGHRRLQEHFTYDIFRRRLGSLLLQSVGNRPAADVAVAVRPDQLV